jgi:hypothetical protein
MSHAAAATMNKTAAPPPDANATDVLKIPVSAVNVMGFAKESAAIVANVVITPTTADVLRILDTVVVVVGWVLGLIGPATGAVFLNKVNPPFILRVFLHLDFVSLSSLVMGFSISLCFVLLCIVWSILILHDIK